MTEEGNIRERMGSEEVEDVFGHCFVIHRTYVWRRTVVAEILRREREVFNSGKESHREMRDALGRRQVAGGHGGALWIATTNSVSSHYHTVSHIVGARAEKRKENTHNNPCRMTRGRSIFELWSG